MDVGQAVITPADAAHAALLERDRELDRIGRCLQQAAQGRGSSLIVAGPPGIGKTALLLAARDAAEAAGFEVLRARGAELEREFAFGVVRQLVEPRLASAAEAERATVLAGPPLVAARLLGFPGVPDDAGGPAPAAPDPSFAVLHGLYWLCANLAADHPLALMVDDVHWADNASLRFFAFLLPRLEELRAALLLAARPTEAGETRKLLAAMVLDPVNEVVRVRPLTTEGVARMVAAGLGADPEPGFAEACRVATGGTPLLVRLLIDELQAEGVAPIAASSGAVERVATATLGSWAVMRVERLGPDAVRLAQAVAVLERAELGEAAELAGLAADVAAQAAEQLVRAGVLAGSPLGFVHPVLRAGIVGDISPANLAEEHRRAARVLASAHASPARVAEQLLGAAATGDSWVVDRLRAAARTASASGAPESAAAYLRRALAEPPAPDVEASVLLDLGVAEYSAGEPGWEDHLEAALEVVGDDATRLSAATVLALALAFDQRLAEAVAVCDRVSPRVGERETDAHGVLEAMAVACGLLDAAVAPSVADRARRLVRVAAQPSASRNVLGVAAYVAATGNHATAVEVAELARRAVAAGPSPLPNSVGQLWFSHAMVALFYAEEYDEAQALLDAAEARARAAADGLVLPSVLAQRAWLAERRGRLTAAEADARSLLDASGLVAPPLYCLLATGALLGALVERGELEQAENALAPLRAELQSTTRTAAVLRNARGRLRFAQRRYREALTDLLAAGDIALRCQAGSPAYLPWRSDAALAHLALGESSAAQRLSQEELDLARWFGAPRALGVALRAAGLVAGGQRGEQLLREAIEVLSGPDHRLEQARALTDLGALLRRSNRRVEAREVLRQAVDAAHRVNAAPLAARASTELRATGARPRRVLLSGLEALTASELRIAELAAKGLTNREIAQALFVTDRTVEGHLTNVFAKLAVTARTELPAAMTTRSSRA